jgi:hypothetical protein
MTKRIETKDQQINLLISCEFNKLMAIFEKYKMLYEVVNSMRKSKDVTLETITNEELEILRNDTYLKRYKNIERVKDIYKINKDDFELFYFEERLKDFKAGDIK